jgi:hypothetical protein
MSRTACTEPQCLYKGALYLTVELYLYSPYEPYGLYRASVPVQGCTLLGQGDPIFNTDPITYNTALTIICDLDLTSFIYVKMVLILLKFAERNVISKWT